MQCSAHKCRSCIWCTRGRSRWRQRGRRSCSRDRGSTAVVVRWVHCCRLDERWPTRAARPPACLPLLFLHSRCAGALFVVGLGAGLLELFENARPFAAWRIGAARADGATVRAPAIAHLAAIGRGGSESLRAAAEASVAAAAAAAAAAGAAAAATAAVAPAPAVVVQQLTLRSCT